MNKKAALIAYVLTAGSTAAFVLTRTYLSRPFDFASPIIVIPIAGMVLGPYFGTAALNAKNRSVWVEANRLIHLHISIPFIAGLALWFGLGFTLGVLITYSVTVFLGTVMAVMAERSATSTKPPERTEKHEVSP